MRIFLQLIVGQNKTTGEKVFMAKTRSGLEFRMWQNALYTCTQIENVLVHVCLTKLLHVTAKKVVYIVLIRPEDVNRSNLKL